MLKSCLGTMGDGMAQSKVEGYRIYLSELLANATGANRELGSSTCDI